MEQFCGLFVLILLEVKHVLGISLLILYLSLLVRPVIPLIEYKLNKDYIANFLCINKAKPKMHCDGKCYLKTKLKKASNEQQDSPHPVSAKSIDPFIKFAIKTNPQYFLPKIQGLSIDPYWEYLPLGYLPEIFHPPMRFV